MKHNTITNNMICDLRDRIHASISDRRLRHILGVEYTAEQIGQALEYNCTDKLRAAALLHDITKEYSFEKQLKICKKFGIILRDDEINCPAVIHAITAAAIIPSMYSEYALEEIISAVRWHTTGRADMSLEEKIIFLADYIEDGRTHAACCSLRDFFWTNINKSNTYQDKIRILNIAVGISLENTIDHLKSLNVTINQDTIAALSHIKAIT